MARRNRDRAKHMRQPGGEPRMRRVLLRRGTEDKVRKLLDEIAAEEDAEPKHMRRGGDR